IGGAQGTKGESAIAVRARCRRVIRRWLAGYVVALLGIVPIALPCWERLRDTLGRFVTVEAFHVVEYSGLGWLAVSYARAAQTPPRALALLIALIAGVGLLDEAMQVWLPARVFEWSDVFLNWGGSLLGAALCGTLARLMDAINPARRTLSTR
ncbi:MAG: VanZ family protein, partial [Candidatus Omnitrophica bacterium]|nr:VanZ family protein [Candidatus Omnitrophota bacterium]